MLKRHWWMIVLTLVAGPFLGFLAGGWTAYVSPKLFESASIVQPMPVVPATGLPIEITSSNSNSRFIATQIEIISSQKISDVVIDELELIKEWGIDRESARARLDRAILANHIEGTDLIEIRVRTPRPHESRIIAGAATQAYIGRQRDLASQRLERPLNELREAVRSQEDLVEEKRRVIYQIIKNAGSARISRDAESLDEEVAAELARHSREDAEADLEAAKSVLGQLKLKLVSHETNMRSGMDTVIVHSDPVEAASPAHPQIKRLVWRGALSGFALSIVLALLLAIIFRLTNNRLTP